MTLAHCTNYLNKESGDSVYVFSGLVKHYAQKKTGVVLTLGEISLVTSLLIEIIRNAKDRIHCPTVYTSVLFWLAKIISKAKDIFCLHTVYTGTSSYCAYRSIFC